jgi:hypothetical protein
MALELGIFMGAKQFGRREQREKRYMVVDTERYRYRDSCSDIAGQDIRAHDDAPAGAIVAVHGFLSAQQPNVTKPGAARMCKRYEDFTRLLPAAARKHHVTVREIGFNVLRNFVLAYLRSNP